MEFLALLLAVAGLIWGVVLLKRGGLLAGCLIVMLAGACFGLEFFKLPLGPLPLTADRLMMLVLVGHYFVWRRFGWADPKPLGKSEIALCLFVVVLILRTFTADFSERNYQPVAWLFIFYLMPCGLYWIARQEKYSERTMHFLFVSLTVFGVYLALTAVAEHYELAGAIFPRYIVETAAGADAEFVGRARGPYLHPIGDGIALAVCFGASLMLWPLMGQSTDSTRTRKDEASAESEEKKPKSKSLSFQAIRQKPRSPENNGTLLLDHPVYGKIRQLMLLPLFLLFLVALYFTLTRSVWMGAALTLAVIVGLSLPWNWRLPLLAGGLLAVVVFSATQWDQLLAFKRDKNLDAEKVAESVELRPVLARIAWNMFLDRPLLGCGYGQYTNEHVKYLADRSTALVLEKGRGYIQHNVFLSLLTETGLVGLGLFVAMCILWGIDAWRLWQSNAALPYRQMGLLMLAVLGVYFINGMFHDVSVTPMANMTLFFLAGITAGLRPRIAGGNA
jgi:hypothetical protein